MNAGPVSELRVVLTVDDVLAALSFYRDALGMPVIADFSGEQGQCFVLDASSATIELIDARQADYIDQAEVGRRIAGPVRLAVAVPDPATGAEVLAEAGGRLEAHARLTPWGDVTARVLAPNGMQLTLFAVPED